MFGIYSSDEDIDTVKETYTALYALQHRGQESAGIVVNDGGEMKCVKNIGTVSETFSSESFSELKNGKIAVGHVCYSPQNRLTPVAAQPLLMRYLRGSLALAQNGALTNKAQLHKRLEQGEVVVVDENGLRSFRENCSGKTSMCLFEYVYVARPDSVIDGVSVYMARQKAGRILAQEHPVEADMVCGVPDSGLSAALGYSIESGIPYGTALIKNKYIGRSFAQKKISDREEILKVKLNVLKAGVEGKRIVIIDDSIIHGATCAYIVKILRAAGAKEIHMRVSSPPFLNPCYYGIDISDKSSLVSNMMSTQQLCEKIGADSLGFLSIEGLHSIASGAKVGLCDACFSGNYPAPVPTEVFEDKFARKIEKK